MTAQFTDRSDADDAAWQAETERLDRLTVADEDTVERVARAIADTLGHKDPAWYFENYRVIYVRYARAAIAALKPEPGTDSSDQAVQRVLALADELETGTRPGLMGFAYDQMADRIRTAVAGTG